MASFDRYVIVDWNAASRPRVGPDSVWIGNLGSRGSATTLNPSTRGAAEEALRDLLVAAVRRGERVLVGFDFPLAFPRGLARALGLDGASWDAVSRHLAESLQDDVDTNRNNRFDVAAAINSALEQPVFWGCPGSRVSTLLSSRKDRVRYRAGVETGGLEEWREVERLLRGGGLRPHSAWQLLGAGSVGGQALTGIPVVWRLRRHPGLAELSRVWPFELLPRVLPEGTPAVIHAEVWPSLIGAAAADDDVKDRVQVVSLARGLRELDRAATLADVLSAPAPAAKEEGWILGVGADGANLLRPAGHPQPSTLGQS